MPGGPDEFQRLMAYVAVGWSVVVVFLWGALMTVPNYWHTKMTLWYSVDVGGLWKVTLRPGVVTGAIQEALSEDARKWVKKLVWKTESISDFQQRMCAPLYRNAAKLTGSNVCQIWISFLQGTYAFTFFVVLGCFFLLLAAVFTWRHYMWNLTRSKIRTCQKGFVIAGPTLITIGTILYVTMTQDFADMPPRRVRSIGANWGTCTGMAVLLTLVSYGPLLLSFCCLRTPAGELFGDAEHERKKFAQQLAFETKMADGMAAAYGQGPAGASAQYGATTQQQQGSWHGVQGMQDSWQGAQSM
jgi:hypothetical protein